jgi:oligopeptidase A
MNPMAELASNYSLAVSSNTSSSCEMRFLSLSRPSVAFLTSTLYFSTEISHSHGVGVAAAAAAAGSDRVNPLLQYQQLPKFHDLKLSDYEPGMEVALKNTSNDFRQHENKLKAPNATINYSNVIEELEKIQAPLTFSWGIIGHLMSVQNNDELRKIHDLIQPSVVKFNQELGQNKVLYDCLLTLRNKQELWDSLDEAQQRIVNCSLRDMQKSGVGLSTPERAVFNQFQLEVSELKTRFGNNVLDSTKAFTLNLTSRDDVEGLPGSAKALLAQQAVRGGFPNVRFRISPFPSV